jgi:hypothetical protein
MPTPAYLAHPGAAVFDPTIHPGIAPPTVTGTAAIAEAHRKFLADIKEHTHCTTVCEELKKQIIAAVPDTYLAILSDDEMGYADVTCATTCWRTSQPSMVL